MHKHGIVRAISAFSFTALSVILIGAISPKVCAETVSGSETVSSNFGENKRREQIETLAEETETKRLFRDRLVQRMQELQQNMPVLENSLRQLDVEIAQMEQALSVLQAEDASVQRQRSAAAIAAWCDAHGVENDVIECASFSLDDRFAWPAEGYSTITCDFGDGHRGIDISGHAIYGTPITAASGGIVTHSGWMGSYGYCVFIDHGDGFSTRYAHACELSCQKGDTVLPGQTIAYVGSTGYSTGPHLHFEVLYNGVLQDPFDFY